MTCQIMMSLGVYVLGAADAPERARVEEHLPGCPACRAELAHLRPLPGLLAGVPVYMRAGQRQPGAARRPARATPPGMPRRSWRAAAVSVVAAAAGVAAGWWLASAGTGQPPAAVTLSAANPAMHVSATAALTATSWGTSIQLQLRGVPLNVQCSLIVRSRTGAAEVAGVWDSWRAGPITVPASAGWLPSDIASLQVAAGGKTLVIISGRPRLPGRAERHVAPFLGTARQSGHDSVSALPRSATTS
jgi:anti-sigma factor RsiW